MASIKASRVEGGLDHFDLLPFIALMMIVLATLLFITMAMASMNVGVGAAEGWIPTTGPDSSAKRPTLVEWDGEAVVIHRTSGFERIFLGSDIRRWWNSDWKISSGELRAFLDEMDSVKETDYVLFAVRPSGFENFQTLAAEFRERGISVGSEPLEQGKRIRLKLSEEVAK